MLGMDAVVPSLVMIRPTPVPMMIEGVVSQERRHTLRQEWVLFASLDVKRVRIRTEKVADFPLNVLGAVESGKRVIIGCRTRCNSMRPEETLP